MRELKEKSKGALQSNIVVQGNIDKSGSQKGSAKSRESKGKAKVSLLANFGDIREEFEERQPCCLGSGACYACGQTGHILRDCPSKGGRGRAHPTGSAAGSSSSVRLLGKGSQASAGRGRGRGGASSSSGPQNHIYALAR
ncbi:uncharacterized protein LOC132612945 [Lycium barbarum]|uniref:uncharacterized protein LOC132612945 n=1 Tax=Lycium barbarum TaxID=112863 RepID=UPI00293E73B4|nr:uncharacterized protein LOC132612945 [Lycium barbarum]